MNPSFHLRNNINPIAKFLDVDEKFVEKLLNLSRYTLLVYDDSCDDTILKMCTTFGIPSSTIESFKDNHFDQENKIVILDSLLFKCPCGTLIKCDKMHLNEIKNKKVFCSLDCNCLPKEAILNIDKYYDGKYNTFGGTLLQNCQVCKELGNSICYLNKDSWIHEVNKVEISVPIKNGNVYVKDLQDLKIKPIIII